MPKYIVQENARICHGVKGDKEPTIYSAGDEIELTEKEAAALGEHNVKPVNVKKKEA